MKIWRLATRFDPEYAYPIRIGSWLGGGLCPECTASSSVRVPPCILELERGSGEIGDFTLVGFEFEAVVTTEVVQALQPLGGFEPGPVQWHVPDPSWLHDRHLSLHELWIKRVVALDMERSSVELERACATCGVEAYRYTGLPGTRPILSKRERIFSSRQPGKGLYLPAASLEGDGLFRVRELPGWMLCTDAVKDLVLAREFTNVLFAEMGECY